MTLNETDILSLIKDAVAPRDGDGFTSKELRMALKWSQSRTMRAIGELVASGDIQAVMLDRVNLHGHQGRVKGYILPLAS